MTVYDTLPACFALTGAVLLVVAAVSRRGDLTAVIEAHGLLPAFSVRLAPLIGPAEGLAGAAVLAGWVSGEAVLLRFAAFAVALWYLALAGYLAVLLRRKGRVPCGCLDETSPASPVKVGRAVLLALATAPLTAGWPPIPAETGARLAACGLAAFMAGFLVVAGKVADLRGTSAVHGQ
ncbi:MauE/DoxX family redox-associated membrane protein [Nonomuraea sp. SBT364]|uniref:MauE/DoxX family redox-associated membrane protein n=1 Tax=Nonomuraea sp. SBT364 TaxID=1580530 RepID=UPI00066E0D04|nr:MauE/DoxX family redox-associated membrane protein [Nonomuraea sp. SBT364]